MFLAIFLTAIVTISFFAIPINQFALTHEHTHESHDHSMINGVKRNQPNETLSHSLSANYNSNLSEIQKPEIDGSDAIEIILIIEEELQEHGTSIVSELYKLYDYYMTELSNSSSDNQENILLKIGTIDEIILMYEGEFFVPLNENYSNTGEPIPINSTYAYYHISPNCICNWLNYLLETPCYYCQQYYNTQMAVTAILAGFTLRGWSLAADLLLHSMSNPTLDSYYTPNSGLVNRVKQSAQILDGVAQLNGLTGAYEQDDPGWLNGVFANTLDGDIFNSLGSFYYSKSYAGNGNVNISILDRYDYARGSSSPGGILIDTMVTAQDIGVSIPFYTKMDITVPGTASLSWEYTSTGVSIIGAPNNISQIIIPSEFYDLRVKELELPKVNANNMKSGAFSNLTQLSQITIPSSVTHIGSDAFKNTNNASIYLTGRTKAPSTFDLNWNSSANPVYLNGTLCQHTSVTKISLSDAQHGDLCNDCRTIINKANHRKYTSNGWQYCYDCSYSKYVGHTHIFSGPYIQAGEAGHLASCSCGATSLQAHIAGIHEPGDRYVNCIRCGYLIDLWSGGPIIIMRHDHSHEDECTHDDHLHEAFDDMHDMMDMCCNNMVAIVKKEELYEVQ